MKLRVLSIVALLICTFTRADDNKLSDILVPGSDWQVAVDHLGFADGLSCDSAGNVYFTNLKATPERPAGVYRLSTDGKVKLLAEPGRSGTKVGPDGRTLYACSGD